MAKHIEDNVKIVEKPEDAENAQEFENTIRNNKKNSLVSVLLRHNISYFEEAYENNWRNLRIKTL